MGKKYNIIYADPPWQYKVYSKKGEGRSAENHYHTMNIEDIRSLPVGRIADDDCILFLWITFPCLIEGISVMEAWGFTYKTCGFNWVKRNKKADTFFMGLGFWTRSNSEICILGTKGRPKRVSKLFRRCAMQGLWNTAKSRTRYGSGLWNCAGTYHG